MLAAQALDGHISACLNRRWLIFDIKRYVQYPKAKDSHDLELTPKLHIQAPEEADGDDEGVDISHGIQRAGQVRQNEGVDAVSRKRSIPGSCNGCTSEDGSEEDSRCCDGDEDNAEDDEVS